jgi:NAD(P)-dependent dehydrogenase (short-subunit alcohol dehydrogenase family)
MDLFDLSDDVVVIIGGTGVLGGSMAVGLATAGARVAILGRNAARGQARVDEINDSGGQAVFIAADATQRTALEHAHQQVRAQFGQHTVLVNAAGGNNPNVTVGEHLAFEDIKLADLEASLDLNLVGGIFLPCQVFGPSMAANRRGSIINIASVSGHIPLSGVGAYSAAKSAVLSLTRFLARLWAEKGVRVNAITPGFFPAEQNRRLLFDADGNPSARGQEILNHTPMNRFGSSEELMGAAVFLAAGPASSFVTGTDICVDGGFLSTTI